MKKVLMLGVSGAAMLLAVSAHAGDRFVKQDQDSTQLNPQTQLQGQAGFAGARSGRGGDGGAPGADGGGSGAAAVDQALDQRQRQRSSQSAAQGQSVEFGGGMADANSDDASTSVSGDRNKVTSHSAIAEFGGMAATTGGLNVKAEKGGFAAGRDNVYQTNNTDMYGKNIIDDITLKSGDANGGKGYGGDASNFQKAEAENKGWGGDATAVNKGTYGGKAYSDADATNKAYQDNFAVNKADGGKALALADADADSHGKAAALSGAGAANFGAAVPIANGNSVALGLGRRDHVHADDGGDTSTKVHQSAKAASDADARVSAPALAMAPAKATGGDAKTGDQWQKNSADQSAKAASAARGGDANALAKAYGGDNTQMAAVKQGQKAIGGAGTGGAGGDTSVHFGSGGFGALTMSSMHGVSSLALNTGVQANQYSAFSVNANARF